MGFWFLVKVGGSKLEIRSSNCERRRTKGRGYFSRKERKERRVISHHIPRWRWRGRKLRYDKRAQRRGRRGSNYEGRGSNYEGRRAKFEVRIAKDEGLNVYCFHLVLGDVGGGKGDDSWDGDNDTGLGVDACHTAYNTLEGAVDDADWTAGTIVYLGIGDRI